MNVDLSKLKTKNEEAVLTITEQKLFEGFK